MGDLGGTAAARGGNGSAAAPADGSGGDGAGFDPSLGMGAVNPWTHFAVQITASMAGKPNTIMLVRGAKFVASV